jgi:hypothetical protein
MTAADLLESLDRHFMAGCPSLSTSQLREHDASGACRECSERASSLHRAAVVGGTPRAPASNPAISPPA